MCSEKIFGNVDDAMTVLIFVRASVKLNLQAVAGVMADDSVEVMTWGNRVLWAHS